MMITDLAELLVERAKTYAPGAADSLERNRHMHRHRGPPPDLELVRAVLVDYINYVAGQGGCDLALYSKDLGEAVTDLESMLAPLCKCPWPSCRDGSRPCPAAKDIRAAAEVTLDRAIAELSALADAYAGTEKWCIGLRDAVDRVRALKEKP